MEKRERLLQRMRRLEKKELSANCFHTVFLSSHSSLCLPPRSSFSPRSRVRHTVFLLFFCLLFAAVAAWADPFSFSFAPPTADASGSLLATVSATVPEGYHLYRDQMAFSVSAGKAATRFPPHHTKDDPLGGGKVDVYDAGTHLFGLTVSELPPLGATLTVEYQGCSTKTCFMPSSKMFSLPGKTEPEKIEKRGAASEPVSAALSQKTPGGAVLSQDPTAPGEGISTHSTAPVVQEKSANTGMGAVRTPTGQTDFERNIREHGMGWAILLAFFGGVLVSFTPCVYPMIPITLSIIGGRTENRTTLQGFVLSITYVAGLSLTYAFLGLAVSVFGAHIRSILQGPVFQIGVSVLFFLLALSMFDVFLLQMPLTLRNRLTGVKSGGLVGIFIMGMISGLMASPCVAAPLAGILAFIAASGNSLLGFLLLLAFAWGMGMILIVIGTFSGSLNALPRAGEWMDRVKEFYGFLLLGAALYFAQPVLGMAVSNLLTALLLASFAAFLGVFQPTSAEEVLFKRVLRCWGILSLSVAVAFAVTAAAVWGGLGLPPMVRESPVASSEKRLQWHDSLEKALQVAKTTNRLVFVDFRADWCAICRELEERVFPVPNVQEALSEMVLLKVDATVNTPEMAERLKKFQVVGLPTLLILKADGTEMPEARIVGDVSADDLSKHLRSFLSR